MKLTDLKVNEYLEILKSDAPAPGGGSASALCGAQGMALLIMVCGLTLGREKYADYQEACAAASENAQGLLKAFINAIDEDTQAYNLVSNAFKMPKETDEQKQERSAAIQAGTIKATQVPLSVMKTAYQGLEIISGVTGKTNSSAMSDLGVAVLNLSACARGAWLNVKINLSGIKDIEKSKRFQEEAQNTHHKIDKIVTELYNSIAENM